MITLITCGFWQFSSQRALQTPAGSKDTGKTNFLSLVCIGKPVPGNWGRNQQCGAEINLKRWAWGEDWVIASLPSPLAMTLAAHSSQHRSWSEFTHGKKLLLLACTVLVNS